MSECAPFHELLSAQLDGELTAAEEQELVRHLAACSACQRYRSRLTRTVEAVRTADASLVDVPSDAVDSLVARLTDDGDPCGVAREQLSAQLDGALGDGEESALLGHLAACSVCQLHRRRLKKTVSAIRGAGVLLVDVVAADYAKMEALLDDAAGIAPAVIAKRPSGRVIPFPDRAQLVRRLAAAAVLAVAVGLALQALPEIESAISTFMPPKQDPKIKRKVVGPKQHPPPQAPVPVPVPVPPDVVEPSPSNEDLLPPDPVDEPRPPEEPEVPLDDLVPPPIDVDEPPDDDVPEPRPHVAIQLAALHDLIDSIVDRKTPANLRAELVVSLGDARFDHPDTYAFLGAVLKKRGTLDRFDEPGASRRAACDALGALGTGDAVAVLLAAPLRDGHADADGAGVLAGLCALVDGDAVTALGDALDRRKKPNGARALLMVEALDALRRPEGVRGLLALFVDTGASPSLRREAAGALGRIGDDRAFGPLRHALQKDRKPRARQGAALGLGSLAAASSDDAADCVVALEAALADRSPIVAEAAVEGLFLTRRRDGAAALVRCLDDQRLRFWALPRLRVLAGRAGARLHSPKQWRVWLDERAPAVIAAVPPEELDLKSFRAVPAASRGVVFVIDTSGSMSGGKWDTVLYELQKGLELCGPSTRFQVLFFSDGPRTLWAQGQLAPATEANKAKALAAARSQSVAGVGQTFIGAALDRALRHEGAEAIYLISDGLETKGIAGVLQRAVRRRNVQRDRPAKIHTIHVRAGGDPVELAPFPPMPRDPEDVVFMRTLAWENGGLYAHN